MYNLYNNYYILKYEYNLSDRIKKTPKIFAYDFGHTYAIIQLVIDSKFMFLTTFHGSKPSPIE